MFHTLSRKEQGKIIAKMAKRLAVLEEKDNSDIEERVAKEVDKQSMRIQVFLESLITKIESILTPEQQKELNTHVDALEKEMDLMEAGEAA